MKPVIIGGIAIILLATVWPMTLQFHRVSWAEYGRSFDLVPSTLLDFPRNILLFMPLGFGLASALDARTGRVTSVLVTVLLGVLSAVCLESLQLYLPNRTPNISDVVANTLGTLAGLSCFRAWRQREPLFRLIRRHVGIVWFAYCVGAVLFVWALMSGMRPAGWDATYRLALGNELTGDEPWQGTVQDLVLLDRAVDQSAAPELLAGRIPALLKDTVVASYALRGETSLKDQLGRLPDLVPQTPRKPQYLSSGFLFLDGAWLATETDVRELTARINRRRQFTAVMTIAVKALTDGIVPILTVSDGPFHRNLTVGQDGTGLALRWRSTLTGANGGTPVVLFPNVFSTLEPRRVVLSTDGMSASVYTDAGAAGMKVTLGPGVGITALLSEGGHWRIAADTSASWWARVLISTLLFLPLGMVLGVAVDLGTRRMLPAGVVLPTIVLPASVVETFVVLYGNGAPRYGMVGLDIGITLLGFVSMVVWRRRVESR